MLVILCHVVNHYVRYFTPLGGIGVAIFLVLSGYGLNASYKKNGLSDYWKKRFVSVFIPYIIIEICTIPLREWNGVHSFILDLFLIKPQHPLGWYMNYLLLWYITFWAVRKYIKKIDQSVLLFVISCIYAVLFFFISAIRFEQSFSFFMGLSLALFIPKKIDKRKLWIYVFGLFSIAVTCLLMKQIPLIRVSEYSSYLLEILDLLIKFSSVYAIMIFACCLSNKVNKSLLCIGGLSYELYLVHGYALNIWQTDLSGFAVIALFTIITIAGTFLFQYVNSRIIKEQIGKWVLTK